MKDVADIEKIIEREKRRTFH